MLDQKEKETVDCFNSDYEPKSNEVFPAEERLIPRWFDDGDRILELGCGMGRLTEYLENSGYDVVAMDISKNRVSTASMRVSSDVMVMDAGNLSFADRSFDGVIFSHNGLDYLHPFERRLESQAEVYRVLKSGGTFLYSTHNRLWLPLPWEEPFNFVDYVRDRIMSGDIFHRYGEHERSVDDHSFTYYGYYSIPWRERDRLESIGFTVQSIEAETTTGKKRFLRPWLNYVAEK